MSAIVSRIHMLLRSLTSLPRLVWVSLLSVIVISLLGLGAWRTQRPVSVSMADQQSVHVTGPLSIDFSQDVAPGYATTIEPALPGSWTQQRTLLGVTAASFIPSGRLQAGQTYRLAITNLRRVGTGQALPDVMMSFKAQIPPAISSFSPNPDAKNVGTKPQFKVVLSAPNRGVREFKPLLAPAVPLKLVSNNDTTYVWEPETSLKQGSVYMFALLDARTSDPAKQRMISYNFTTVAQPVITSARSGGLLAPGQNVDIVFDQPMNQTTEAFSATFKGKGSWVDDHTFRFVPEGLAVATTYHYTIKAGLTSKAGGALEADRTVDVATNGPVTASLSPGGRGIGVNTPVRATFDQPVDHASAESHFSISPAVAGKFSWSGNTMTFSTGLAYQTTYNYGIAAGVVPAWGQPGAPVKGAFTTATEVIKLGVPAYKGQHWMSCELSSLRMLLAYRGVKLSQDTDILSWLNYNPRVRDTATNSWDNPNLMYVGFVDGRPNTTGYGVHAGPIADAAKHYGRNAQAYFNVSAQFIASQVHQGNPVEFWGHSTPAVADSWNTTTGVVQTLVSQHARVVYGVEGSADNPVGFYINEPMNGSTFYWTASQLMANMNVIPGVSNQAVVVF